MNQEAFAKPSQYGGQITVMVSLFSTKVVTENLLSILPASRTPRSILEDLAEERD